MPLSSNLFSGNSRLEACLVSHPSHVVPGDTGEHVQLIQIALIEIDGAAIDQAELDAQRYGPSTTSAVHAYKKYRSIINPAYQSTPDNIVGKMTIEALDRDMLALEHTPGSRIGKRCERRPEAVAVARRKREYIA
jgi:peptidoglycan hydrolase-like protein with peptidoglycan-binding domain